MATPLQPTVDPMAAQMTQLLLHSEEDELREIVRRWIAEAPAGGARRVYEAFGAKLIELKHALAEQPVQPTREELESMLTIMLRLAAEGKAVTLADFPPWFVIAFAIGFGLIWGSFLNVVIYRVPRGLSVVRPGSACPACGKPIRAFYNIPVFGYLLLRGKARCCGVRLSPRYPLVELIGGVLALAVLEVLVLPLPATTSLARSVAVFCASLALSLGLVAAAFIDLEHMILPDSITIGAAVLGVATSSFRQIAFTDALIGAAAGFAAVWLPFIVIYPRLRQGKVGMGLGDAKLLMAAGAWFGWSGALVVLLAGAVQGLIIATLQLAVRGKIEEPEEVRKEREAIRAELDEMTPEERAEAEKELADDPLMQEAGEGLGAARVAFGPFLALATIEYLFFGKRLVEWLLPFGDGGGEG